MVDGGRQGFVTSGEVVLRPQSMNGESDGWGEPCFGLGRACFWLFLTEDGTHLFEIWGKYKLCPLLNFGPTAGQG